MAANLSFHFDREGDVLTVQTCAPYAEQQSEEVGDDVVVRRNPNSGDVEAVEVLFFSTRRGESLDLPLVADMRMAVAA